MKWYNHCSSLANKKTAEKMKNDQEVVYHNSTYNISEYTSAVLVFLVIQIWSTSYVTHSFYFSSIIALDTASTST